MKLGVILMVSCFAASCGMAETKSDKTDSLQLPVPVIADDSSAIEKDTADLSVTKASINTGKIEPSQVIDFAKSLIGTRYKYGSTDPSQGFDCSGFIT